ncbi:MAG: hypothetical protein RH916_02790 [Vicingaceae bacterium]
MKLICGVSGGDFADDLRGYELDLCVHLKGGIVQELGVFRLAIAGEKSLVGVEDPFCGHFESKYSSARDYTDEKGLIEIDKLD